MWDLIAAGLAGLGSGFLDIGRALAAPAAWLDWSDPAALMRFVYYGGSSNLVFALLDIGLVVAVAGFLHRPFLWGVVRGSEAFANGLGRIAAWAGLAMVLQQIAVIFLQGIFRQGEITLAPFGFGMTRSVSWASDSLKFWNAAVVALCISYTFVQGGHVRVDLLYAPASRRAKKVIDMAGSLLFMLPVAILLWHYAWFFLWRSLITPKVSSSDSIEALLRKARIVKWNVERTGFSPNGFDGYFLFKVLMLALTVLIAVQAVTYFFRSALELIEGPRSDAKHLDLDAGAAPVDDTHPHDTHPHDTHPHGAAL